MKKSIFVFAIFLMFSFHSFAQINPIKDLTWYQYYEMPNNYFELYWGEPDMPHDELIGYNIYREDELYRFQTENAVYNLPQGSNCGVDFLMFNGENEFTVHVTAVYNPGPVESGYTQTVFVHGPLISVEDFDNEKTILYPNPTTGKLNIGNTNLNEILLFDISGKKIKEFKPQSQIDLSDLSKGMYLIKLISDDGVLTDKILLE